MLKCYQYEIDLKEVVQAFAMGRPSPMSTALSFLFSQLPKRIGVITAAGTTHARAFRLSICKITLNRSVALQAQAPSAGWRRVSAVGSPYADSLIPTMTTKLDKGPFFRLAAKPTGQ